MTTSQDTITPAGQVVDPAPVGSVAEAGSGVRPPQATDRAGSFSGAGSRPSGQCAGRPASQASMPEVNTGLPGPSAPASLDVARRPPLRSAHSQRPGEANIFSREWRANGTTKPIGTHGRLIPSLAGPRSPIDVKVEAQRAAIPHVPEEIHFARKDHVLSSWRCRCGARGRTCNRDRARGHADLAALFTEHKGGAMV